MKTFAVTTAPLMFSIATVGALGYTGSLSSFGLYICMTSGMAIMIAKSLAKEDHRGISLPITLVSISVLVGLFWIFITIPVSVTPGISFQVAWVLTALPLAYFSAVSRNRVSVEKWRVEHYLLRFLASAVMLTALIEFVLIGSRPTSVFLDINVLAAFCNLFIFPTAVTLCVRWQTLGLKRTILSINFAFLLLAMFCLASTASRGGQIAFIIGVTAFSMIMASSQQKAWIPGIALILLLIGTSIMLAPFRIDPNTLERLSHLAHDQSLNDRIEMLKSAFHMYRDAPWYGFGLGTYKVLYPMYRSAKELSTSGDLAHNDYLQFLAEGGPILFAVILVLATSVLLACVRLWRAARTTALHDEQFLESVGLACSLLCIFIHAALNFIFYVLPISLIAGFYLARLDSLRTDAVRSVDLSSAISPRIAKLLIVSLITFVTATIGLQAAFVSISSGQCKLRMCENLSNNDQFLGKFASFLTATQPSYLPARDWLIAVYTESAKTGRTATERTKSARTAAHELSDLIRHYPAIPYTYRLLADLLQMHSEAETAVGAGISTIPSELYSEALRRDPLDTYSRIHLAKILEQDGRLEQAFSLVFDDGMRWWKVSKLGDQDRIAMLQIALPLALTLGRCSDAKEMAAGLLIFTPEDPMAKSLSGRNTSEAKTQDSESNCGLPADRAPAQ